MPHSPVSPSLRAAVGEGVGMRDVGKLDANGAASQANPCNGLMPRVIDFFRNNDPSALSDVAHEQAIAAIFERYRVPQTIGVVPRHAVGSTHDPYGGKEPAALSIPTDRLTGQVVVTGRALSWGIGCLTGATSPLAALQYIATGGAI